MRWQEPLVAPLTAAALLAQQVASNALRDALFLSWFLVTTFETDDPYLRGTALEYLDTVLPPAIFTALVPRLAAPGARPPRARDAAEARADLLHAGATLKVSLEEMRRQLFRE